jgi:ubiquinone/menaquinone biosynthesis C-methylase UbiE
VDQQAFTDPLVIDSFRSNGGEPQGENQINNLIATSAYWLTLFQVREMARYTGGIINTARPFAYYRKAFFNNQSKVSTLANLQGKKLVDIGCGYTPYAEDSMFRACYHAGIEFYGVDPVIEENITFKARDSVFTSLTGGSGRLDPDAPGLERAISAMAHELPFPDNEIDTILSCWLIPIWISKEEELLNIFTELHRILKVGGNIILYPLPDWNSFQFKSRALKSLLKKFSFNQEFIYEPFNFLYPPTNRISFKKIC